MEIRVINKSAYPLPRYATEGAAGFDLVANVQEPVTIGPMERRIIPTGLYVAVPRGYEMQVRPRSGLAAKKGVTVLNAPGTVDSDYRGEVGVILANMGCEPYVVEPGERIAQGVIAAYERAEWREVDELDDTERGEGGFGHSGRR